MVHRIVTAVMQRQVEDLARVDRVSNVSRLLTLLAVRAAGVVILSTGERRIAISDRITAVPVSAVWNR